MSLRLKIIVAGILAVTLFFAAGFFTSLLISPATKSAGVAVEKTYLYEIQAPSGTITNLETSETQHETFTLTLDALTGEADVVTRFSDRPYREASVLTPDDLTKEWPTLFASSSPNAVLTYLEPGSSIPQSIVVILSEPKHDHNSGQLTFKATRLFREDTGEPASLNFTRPNTPTSFSSASLFIDGASSTSLPTSVPGLVIDFSTEVIAGDGIIINILCGGFPSQIVIGPRRGEANELIQCGPEYQINNVEIWFDPNGDYFGFMFQGQLVSQDGNIVESYIQWISAGIQ